MQASYRNREFIVPGLRMVISICFARMSLERVLEVCLGTALLTVSCAWKNRDQYAVSPLNTCRV